MRRNLSAKQLTLLAGILVALIVALMFASTSASLSVVTPIISIPDLELPAFTKTAIQKISLLF